MKEELNPGKIKPLIRIIASIGRQFPHLLQDPERLIEEIENEVPELKDRTICPNCDASMTQYVYDINVIDVALIIAMGQAVREAMSGGKPFTEANKVHVPTLPVAHSTRCRTTRCAKLGLITKYHTKDPKENSKGKWVITKRGFAALRGEEVPTEIVVWRKKIIDRTDKTVTFAEVQKAYKTKVDKYVKKHNEQPDDDYRDEVIGYNQNEWIDFAGYHDGRLF